MGEKNSQNTAAGLSSALSVYALAVRVLLSLSQKRLLHALQKSFLTEKVSLDKKRRSRLYAFGGKILTSGGL